MANRPQPVLGAIPTATTTSPTYRLTDEQYAQIEELLPPNHRRGGQWNDHRKTIDGILWVLADGGRWRNLPTEFGPWQSVYDRFRRWSRNGLWDQILRRLQARKMRHGEIDWELFCIDGTVVRGHQSAAGAAKKGGPRASRMTMVWAAAKAALAPNCT